MFLRDFSTGTKYTWYDLLNIGTDNDLSVPNFQIYTLQRLNHHTQLRRKFRSNDFKKQTKFSDFYDICFNKYVDNLQL